MFTRCIKEVVVSLVLATIILLVCVFYNASDNFKTVAVQQIPLGSDHRMSTIPDYTLSMVQGTTPQDKNYRLSRLLGQTARNKNHRLSSVQSPVTEGAIQLASRKRIDRVCELIKNGTYNVPQTYDSAIRRPKGVVDNYHGVLYCDIGKTGSTSWHRFFTKMVEEEKQERQRWFKQHPYPWYVRRKRSRWSQFHKFGINTLSKTRESHREVNDGLPDPREDYFRFIQVRHPLERLASAYHSKVNKLGVLRPVVRYRLGNITGEYPGGIWTFRQFLTYVAIPDEEMLEFNNDHFKTYQTLCEPCGITYDYVARQETLDADLNQLLPKFKAIEKKAIFPHLNNNHQTSYRAMYDDIPLSILQPVLDKYQADADMFGYTFDKYHQNSKH